MEYNQLSKKVIDFQKMTFDHWYGAMTLIQSQAESAMDLMLKQATWIPEDGRNALQNWVNACQQERDRFKSYVDKGFATLEKTVTPTQRATAAAEKTAKKAAS